MSYEWDVFFSYKRDPLSDAWHEEFRKRLQFWLSENLNRDAKIFIDTEDIALGQQRPTRLQVGLRRSRSILCVWSPRYFRSRWCYSEWKSFEERERVFGKTLVAPTRFYDGERFPQEAQNRQSRDISPYTSFAPRFWDTELADDFSTKCIKPLAQELAKQIEQAPPFQDDFPLVAVPDAHLPSPEHFDRPANV